MGNLIRYLWKWEAILSSETTNVESSLSYQMLLSLYPKCSCLFHSGYLLSRHNGELSWIMCQIFGVGKGLEWYQQDQKIQILRYDRQVKSQELPQPRERQFWMLFWTQYIILKYFVCDTYTDKLKLALEINYWPHSPSRQGKTFRFITNLKCIYKILSHTIPSNLEAIFVVFYLKDHQN